MIFRDKRILITGSSGFVGVNLIEELEKHNVEVVHLLDQKNNRIDIRNWKEIKEIKDIDIIYHLAAKTFVPNAFKFPRITYDVNVTGTLNLLELCRLCDIEKFIFTSSYVYGQPKYLPIDEKHNIQPTNPYARSKILGEKLCEAYYKDFGVNCTILRPFNIYGPNQGKNFLIPSILSQLKSKKIILNDSKPKRDFIFISDIVDAYIKAGQFNGEFEIFNIGYGKSFSVETIVNKIVELFDRDIEIVYNQKTRKNEIMDTVSNIEKAKRLLKWEPIVNIDEGLKRILDTI